MAKSDAVWGIDIGNCSLKALRCRPAEQDGLVLADAFDYIEYPKILTQPGAEPSELVNDALTEFLSRNNLRGDRVAISVPGQNGLARFVKLPPVESKKIPDIVKFEARQQIPFDLNDVIWDYQRMGGGMEESGFLLETEIGLFAMKRDQVFRALEPLTRAGIQVDVVQLTPLALYNFVCFDQLEDLPPPDEYDPDNPPPSTVVLSMGTDATDLVVTNGFRVWQRSIPVGGNHFTKALTKELKLTFAKAEHLKRNAATAEDPKAVFQAMRPVFNDLLTEVQRSIGYFSSLDRAAQVQRVLAMGNAIKLPGLRRYLAQSLGFEVARLEQFNKLAGPEVLKAPAFQENQLCFPVCYGLALQGLKQSPLHTNLLPKEIIQDRLINAKKPWAVASAAVLLLACTIGIASQVRAWSAVRKDKFEAAERAAQTIASTAQRYKTEYEGELSKFKATEQIGVNVVESVEGRLRWMELMTAINSALPTDPENDVPEDVSERNEVHIVSIDAQRMESFEPWMTLMRQRRWYNPNPKDLEADQEADPALAEILAAADKPAVADTTTSAGTSGMYKAPMGPGAYPGAAPGGIGGYGGAGPRGYPAAGPSTAAGGSLGTTAPASGGAKQGLKAPGWLVQITGYHYHNPDNPGRQVGAEFVRTALIDKLRRNLVFLPTGDPKKPQEKCSMRELGISYPVLVNPGNIEEVYVRNPLAAPVAGEMQGMPGTGPGLMVPGGGGFTGPEGPSGMRPLGPPASMRGASSKGTSGGAVRGPVRPGPMTRGPAGRSPTPTGPRRQPGYPGPQPGIGVGTGAEGSSDSYLKLRRFPFTVQFVWQPLTPAERAEKRQKGTAEPAGSGGAAPPAVQPGTGGPGPAGGLAPGGPPPVEPAPAVSPPPAAPSTPATPPSGAKPNLGQP
jgi:type IV pilus assembly protein PilM